MIFRKKHLLQMKAVKRQKVLLKKKKILMTVTLKIVIRKKVKMKIE
jgi:hypothetical protein